MQMLSMTRNSINPVAYSLGASSVGKASTLFVVFLFSCNWMLWAVDCSPLLFAVSESVGLLASICSLSKSALWTGLLLDCSELLY